MFLYTEKILTLLKEKKTQEIKEWLPSLSPGEIGVLLEDLSQEQQLVVFEQLPLPLATQTFEYTSLHIQKRLLSTLSHHTVAHIINQMAPDDRTTLLAYLPNTVVKELIKILHESERRITLALLGYPESSVGRLMTPDYLAVKPSWTMEQVLAYIRQYGQDTETLSMLYVLNEEGILLDDLRIREILLAPLDQEVSEIMDHSLIALDARQDQEEAVVLFRTHARVALPVTDATGLLLGIVTIDDMLEVVQKEETEDMQKMGGSEALEEPYMRMPLLRMVKKRAGWLVVLFLGEMLTATAMGFFEEEIAKAVVLALFVPLIISSGGNSGSQATSLIIRAVALGEINLRDWWKIMRREWLAGLLLGGILGLIGFLRIVIWSFFSTVYGPHWLLVAATVGCSLVGVVLWGSLAGSMLPLILKKLRFDPATSSAPFVATLVDVTGLIIYFSVAYLLLKGTLL